MADEADDTLDERLETILRRAENFRELLRDGDEVTIGLLDGEVHVEESYRSKFERLHPKLFGRMLAIEAQMQTGLLPYFAAIVVTSLFIVSLQLGWWEPALGENANDTLQGWWFYLALPAAVLYLARSGCRQYEKYVYRRNRPELVELIAAAALDRDVLLVMLRDDGELDDVVRQMKLDRGAFPKN